MPVNLSIKNVPDATVEHLRHRAKANHRSLQGELLAVVEQTVHPSLLKPRDVLKRLRALHFRTPAESLSMIREDRRAR
jgi:plasmid stability protein